MAKVSSDNIVEFEATEKEAKGPDKKLPPELWNRIMNFTRFNDILARWGNEQELKEGENSSTRDVR
jgi:hypothetical protein